MEKVLGKMQSAIIGFISAFVFREIIQGFDSIIQAGIDFDSSFKNAQKTLEGTAAQFATLNAEVRQMAKDIPIAVTEINRIAEAGGQVGVGITDIKQFTETIAVFASSTRIGADEAATSLKRLSTVLQEPIGNIQRLASVIVDLDAKNAASAQEILAFSMNIAAAGKNVGLSSPQILGLAAALASTGLHAEKAGSAISRIFIEMQNFVEGVGKGAAGKLDEMASVAGKTGDAFKKAFKEDAAGALVSFLDGLRDKGEKANQILDNLGLHNIRTIDVIGRLKRATEDTTKAMADASVEYEKNGAALRDRLGIELSKTEAQLTLAKNRLTDVAISLSQQFTPAIVKAAGDLASFAEFLRDHSDEAIAFAAGITAIATAFTVAKLASFATDVISLGNAFFLMRSIFEGFTAGGLLSKVATGFQLMVGPIGAVALALGGVVALAVNLYEKWEKYKEDSKAIAEANKMVADSYDKQKANLMQAVENYKKHGIVLEVYGKDLDQIQNLLNINKNQLLKNIAAEQTAIKTKEEHTNTLRRHTAEQEKYREAVQKIIDSTVGVSKADKEFLDALDEMLRTGVDANVILSKHGTEIERLIHVYETLGIELPTSLKIMGAFIDKVRDQNAALNSSGTTLSAYEENLHQVTSEYRDLLDVITKAEQKFENQPLSAIMRPFTQNLPGFVNGVPDIAGPSSANDNSMLSPQKIKELSDAANKAAKTFADSVNNDVDRATDRIFRHFIETGRVTSKDLGDFFSRAFDKVIDAFMKPARDALSGLITSLVSGKDGKGGLLGALTGDGGLFKTIGDKFAGLFTSGESKGKWGSLIGGALSAGVTAAIGIGLSFVTGLLKKSGSEVNNNLVQKIQNPFTEAVGKMLDSFDQLRATGKLTLESAVQTRSNLTALFNQFMLDTDAYASTGTKQATAVQNALKDIFSYWGDGLSGLFDKIDGAIVDLGGTAGMTTDDLKDLEAALKVIDDFNKAVESLVKSVTANADNVDVLTTALQQLKDASVPTSLILGKLSGNIMDTVEELTALGRPIPPLLKYFYDLAVSMEKAGDAAKEIGLDVDDLTSRLKNSQDRLKDINKELHTIADDLSKAFNDKLQYIDDEIAKSTDKISGWRKQIADINAAIVIAQDTLADATHWQARYNDVIRDAESAYKSASDKRMSIEKEIADLQKEIEKDRLNDIIKNSKNETMVKLAKIRLQEMDKQADVDKIARLAELQKQLPETIRLENEAKDALEKRKTVAEQTIAAEKLELQTQIETKTRERNALLDNIIVEQQRIQTLFAEKDATLRLMSVLGIAVTARETETDRMNKSIESLLARRHALEDEASALDGVIAAIKRLLAVAPSNNLSTGAQPLQPPQTSLFNGFNNPPTVPGTNISSPIGPIVFPSYDVGNPYVSSDQLAMLHRGERVLTAQENSYYSGGVNVRVDAIHYHSDGSGNPQQEGQEFAYAFVRSLKKDGTLRREMTGIFNKR